MKISKDINGNKTLKIESVDTINESRGFSIQTLGNLPITHRDGICNATIAEVKVYIADHGTKLQKSKLDTLLSRSDYMSDSSNLHQRYYAQFVTEQTKAFVLSAIGIEKLTKSTDKHLNDVVRMGSGGGWVWDCSPFNTALAKKAGEISHSGSPSTHTCIGKAAARIILNEQGV